MVVYRYIFQMKMFPPRERNSNSIMRTSLNDPLHTVIHSRSEHIESRSDIAVVDDSWIDIVWTWDRTEVDYSPRQVRKGRW